MSVRDPESQSALEAIEASANDPDIVRAGHALMADDIETAEPILRRVLQVRPDDVVALEMLGEIAARVGVHRDAEQLFRRALQLAPVFDYARIHLAKSLQQQNRPVEALAELDRLGAPMSTVAEVRDFRASILGRVGGYEEAIAIHRDRLTESPNHIRQLIGLAYNLQTVGKTEEAIATYRRVLELNPAVSEAWWRLANLKTFRFEDPEVAVMEAALESDDLGDSDRLYLHFALGKAYEDREQDERAFAHYRQGNALQSNKVSHDPEGVTRFVEALERLFTPELFAAREGAGCASPDPIFIVGMPRAGSTLVEQILASHPMIEGTAELADLVVIVRSLETDERGAARGVWQKYPQLLADLPPAELKRLGQLYIDRTRARRKTDRPFFTDKMPINWIHVGFIKLILPNAKIVDVRRSPLASGFSIFKHYFTNRWQEFAYDLPSIGSYYRNYVRFMRHFDRVAPGTVHRVIHDRLVADPEGEIRRLLEYVGVPFDDSCFRFYESDRPVPTPSSEQVRKPLNVDTTERWRRFEKWLGPLKQALGPVLDDWEDAPVK